jgi:hypothetical protein
MKFFLIEFRDLILSNFDKFKLLKFSFVDNR